MNVTVEEVQQLLGEKDIEILGLKKQIVSITGEYNKLKQQYDDLVNRTVLREAPKHETS